MNLYEYNDYKKYLVDLLDSEESGGLGKRKQLAEAIGCQVSHITNALSGDAHFSQEQAEAAARFFGLNSQETEFFLLLLQCNRAGTTALKKVYEGMLGEQRKKFGNLKTRLKMPDSLQSQDETRYYSGWQYGAVHVLLSIPEYQTREAIAKRLQLPLAKVDEVLGFLVETGLCKKEGQRYLIARPLLHLDKSSPLIAKHHTNWRLRSILSLDEIHEDELHYSGVFTISKKDYPRVKEAMTKTLAEALKLVTESPEEEAAVLCIDLFRI